MSEKHTITIEDIKSKAIPIARKYGVQKLALFGSYARGDNREDSDIDFIIDNVSSDEMFAFFGFANALEDEFGVAVDVLTYEALPQNKYFGPIEEVVLYE